MLRAWLCLFEFEMKARKKSMHDTTCFLFVSPCTVYGAPTPLKGVLVLYIQ